MSITIENGNENTLPQIMIFHAHDHNYTSMSCDSEIPVNAYKTILLKQKKTGETGTKIDTVSKPELSRSNQDIW
jgi:hypothetical protein